MPLTLEGSCHCKAVKFTVESNTPVPFQICQCSICRKVGGYLGASNIMGNTGDAFKILRGEDKIKVYIAPLKFDKDDKPTEMGTSKRSFCTECSTMLWNYHDEYPQWIYPFASTIDKPDLPLVPEGVELISILRDSCPNYVPIPQNAKPYPGYGPGEGIEAWHKKHGAWVE